ncbi:MAG: acyl-ACP thioesterase [Treponema sp.]|jgi:acyl-ACP thioesterase|nr:acyl-ACP thioesterase [Treponema sp.]
MDIYEEKCKIRFADIDCSDTLTAGAVFEYFQEAAIHHAEILGVGRDAMNKRGAVWVLSRLSVFINRRPRFGEEVMVRSWPRGPNRLFAIRDYDIRGESQEPMVRGRSAWLIIDLDRRRPLRPQELTQALPRNEGIDALPGPAGGNEAPPQLAGVFGKDALVMTRTVRYSDIDYNGHMNNTRYIQWIQDGMESGVLENARQMRIDINYLSEARFNEKIVLFVGNCENVCADAGGSPSRTSASFAIEGRRAEGEAVFRAELRCGL